MEIKQIMSAVFEMPVELIGDDASTDNIDNWDSLGHLSLILALEEQFDVTIPEELIDSLVNYSEIKKVISDLSKSQ